MLILVGPTRGDSHTGHVAAEETRATVGQLAQWGSMLRVHVALAFEAELALFSRRSRRQRGLEPRIGYPHAGDRIFNAADPSLNCMERLRARTLVLLLLLYVPYAYFHGYGLRSHFNIDFPTFYSAAQVAFERGVSPYTSDALADDVGLLGESMRVTVFGGRSIKIGPYLYPPPSLLLFYPLTLVSFGAAKMLLLVVNHLCLLLFLYLVLGRILRQEFGEPAGMCLVLLCCAYAFVYFPVIAVLQDGQVNLIVLVCLCATWLAWKNGSHPVLIAVPLTLAVLLKTYPILLMPLLLMRRQYRATIWAGALLALTTAISYFMLPGGAWRDWLVNVVPTGGYGKAPFNLFSPAQARNHNINGFASRLFTENGFAEPLWISPALAAGLAYLLAIVVVLVTVGVCLLATRRSQEASRLDREFCLFLLMILLVAPLTWESHLVFALPVALLAIHDIIGRKQGLLEYVVLAVTVVVLAWNLHVESPSVASGLWTLLIPAKFYALVALWLVFVAQLFRSTRHPAVNQA